MKAFRVRSRLARCLPLLPAALLLGACSHGSESLVEAGQAIAEQRCSRCHDIGRMGASPLAAAPPFRRLHERYKIDDLAEALAEGIIVGHKQMPAFVLSPPQIDALLAYMKSL